jgi:predicted aldo/keto reductase-like oxidoreductase
MTGVAAGTIIPLEFINANAKIEKDKWGELLPLRRFGKTNEKVTMMGLGGFHIGKHSDYEAQKTIETAISGGIRFIDTAESYQSGVSEDKLGRLMVPKYRDEIFLMTKTKARNGNDARKDLEESLKRLHTDHIDLWLVHSVNSVKDVEDRLAEGVIDTFLKAKQEGKTRYIGFSGHVTPEAHLRIMEISDEFAACMLPVNLVDPSYNSFIKNVIPELQRKDYGIIAMKTLAGGGFFGGGFEGNARQNNKVIDFISIQEAIQFALSMPVSTLVTGPDNSDMLQEKIDIAKTYSSMDETKQEELISKVAQFANTRVEYYKD